MTLFTLEEIGYLILKAIPDVVVTSLASLPLVSQHKHRLSSSPHNNKRAFRGGKRSKGEKERNTFNTYFSYRHLGKVTSLWIRRFKTDKEPVSSRFSQQTLQNREAASDCPLHGKLGFLIL